MLLLILYSICIIMSLMFINVIILPYNEARVRVALSACLPTLLVRSIDGTYGRFDDRFRRTYENSYPSARRPLFIAGLQARSMARLSQGRVGRSDMTWRARARNVFDRLVVAAQPRCRLVMSYDRFTGRDVHLTKLGASS